MHIILVSCKESLTDIDGDFGAEKCMLPSETYVNGGSTLKVETSSVKSVKGHLLKQPKKGFINRVNLALSRMFSSKL